MAGDRITELHIAGLRSIDTLTLPLRGLTVLIGDNGSGKSAIVEACELLRRASTEGFFYDFHQIHGGLFSLLRQGSRELRLVVRVDGTDEVPLQYELVLTKKGAYTAIAREQLDVGPYPGHERPLCVLLREFEDLRIYVPSSPERKAGLVKFPSMDGRSEQLGLVRASGLINEHLGRTAEHRAFERMRNALANIEVHVPFEVTPSWVAQADGRKSDARSDMQLQRVDRLDRLGKNLPNVYFALQNEFGATHWNETLEYVRLGLGYELETISLRAGSSGGTHSLWLKMQGQDEQIPASSISDGMLAYLAFVALYRLPRPERSLLVFDEPDLHLHPELLVRVVEFFETIAETQPVLLTTHSDRLLDALHHPAESVRVCELELPHRKTTLSKLDGDALSCWLERYRGLGDVRSAGHLPQIIAGPTGETS